MCVYGRRANYKGDIGGRYLRRFFVNAMLRSPGGLGGGSGSGRGGGGASFTRMAR
jgi:hypothetical protein